MQTLVNVLLKEDKLTKRKTELLKRKWAREKNSKMPLNSEIWNNCSDDAKEKLRYVLNTKPTRNLAGVSIIAIMPKPNGCPARCTF